MYLSTNPVNLSVIHHLQNPSEPTRNWTIDTGHDLLGHWNLRGTRVGWQNNKCVHNFDGKSSWKTALITTRRWKCDINLEVRETDCCDGRWIKLAIDCVWQWGLVSTVGVTSNCDQIDADANDLQQHRRCDRTGRSACIFKGTYLQIGGTTRRGGGKQLTFFPERVSTAVPISTREEKKNKK
jgi:hypothetical protein